jgi:hypothetical protein
MRFISRRRRLLLCLLGLAALAGVAAGVVLSVGPAATAATPTAPAWLQEKALHLVTVVCKDSNPTSISWKSATAGQYARAVQEPGATVSEQDSGVALYVVVAHGDFTYTAAHLERADAPLPTGHTLIVAFDPDSQVVTDLTLIGADVNAESVLGTMSPIAR